MDSLSKFGPILLAVLIFAAVFALVMLIGWLIGRGHKKYLESLQGYWYILPAMLLLVIGLVYPAILTIRQSFGGVRGDGGFTLSNFGAIFGSHDMLITLLNTVIWTLLVPVMATAIGLLYAIVIDRSRFESFAKTLIFLPMAISMVGASIIWKFMYDYRPAGNEQIGLFNQFRVMLGMEPSQFLLSWPSNTFWLILVMIWIQAGFAMTVLSAAIKAIPEDIIEAAKIDGVGTWSLFANITLPSIRGSLVVVLTTIAIAALKVFDIVRTMTGGQFNTSVVANDFYSNSFRFDQAGIGAALAVVLFIMVIPIVVYNVIQLKRS